MFERLPTAWLRAASAAVAAALVAVAVGGCAQPGPAPRPPVAGEQGFDDAINSAIDDLFAQTQPGSRLPGVFAKLEERMAGKRGVMVEPVLEAGSGNQTTATQTVDARIAQRVAARFTQIELLPFQAASLPRAQYLLTGTIGRSAGAQDGWRIDLALSDLKTRTIAAQASSRARAEGVDATPTAFYRDSPVLLRDNAVGRAEEASRTTVGQLAPAGYLDRVAAAAWLAAATVAYNAERFEQALGMYRQALESPGGDQLRVHSGIYLSNWRLGRIADAETAFGSIVAAGLASRNLGVKFLFRPNSTDFFADAKASPPYDAWVRQIARQAASSRACLNIVGHTSRTGSEQFNDQLSQRRAQIIKQRLEAESADLVARTRASGMGFRENLVGTGSDDTRDALDRRVEFKVDACS